MRSLIGGLCPITNRRHPDGHAECVYCRVDRESTARRQRIADLIDELAGDQECDRRVVEVLRFLYGRSG